MKHTGFIAEEGEDSGLDTRTSVRRASQHSTGGYFAGGQSPTQVLCTTPMRSRGLVEDS